MPNFAPWLNDDRQNKIKKQKKQKPDCPGSPNKNIPPKQNHENID